MSRPLSDDRDTATTVHIGKCLNIANLTLITNQLKSIFLRLFEIGLNLTRVIKNSQCRMKMKYWKIQKWHKVML